MPTESAVIWCPADLQADHARNNRRYLLWVMLLVVVGSIATSRLGRAAPTGFDAGPLLRERLEILRSAIAEYAAEHAGPPRVATGAQLVAQLSSVTNRAGQVADDEGDTMYDENYDLHYAFGPYIGAGAFPVNPLTLTDTVFVVYGMPAVPVASEAWIYSPDTGELRANVTGTDGAGRRWFDY